MNTMNSFYYEKEMIDKLGLIFLNNKKDTKTMHDIKVYSCPFVGHEQKVTDTISIFSDIIVTFFTNNKGNRCFKLSHEIYGYNYLKSIKWTFKKYQVYSAREITMNDDLVVRGSFQSLYNEIHKVYKQINIDLLDKVNNLRS